jgi:hypothetical protein
MKELAFYSNGRAHLRPEADLNPPPPPPVVPRNGQHREVRVHHARVRAGGVEAGLVRDVAGAGGHGLPELPRCRWRFSERLKAARCEVHGSGPHRKRRLQRMGPHVIQGTDVGGEAIPVGGRGNGGRGSEPRGLTMGVLAGRLLLRFWLHPRPFLRPKGPLVHTLPCANACALRLHALQYGLWVHGP